MDWTGGTRNRYTKLSKSSTVLQKQKAYFAKLKSKNAAHGIRSSDEPQNFISQQSNITALHRHGQKAASSSLTSARMRQYTQQHLDRSPVHNLLDEDQIRLSKARLLAKSDWLALEPLQPLRMDFIRSADESRIGRRRKIRKTDDQRLLQPLRSRSITPVFHERDLIPRLGSQTAHENHQRDFRIKIGSDAFLSQTQPSRLPDKSIDDSLRAMSVETGRFTEESMLLGEEDEDALDFLQPEMPSNLTHTSQLYLNCLGSTSELSPPNRRHAICDVHESIEYVSDDHRENQSYDDAALGQSAGMAPIVPSMVHDGSDYEQEWRQTMGVARMPAPIASNLAEKSLDIEATSTVDTGERPPARSHVLPDAMIEHRLDIVRNACPLEVLPTVPSVLRQQQMQQKYKSAPRPQRIDDEETVWRRFVLGSAHSSISEISVRPPSWTRIDAGYMITTAASMVDDRPRSNCATVAYSPSRIQRSGPSRLVSTDYVAGPASQNCFVGSTSMIGNASIPI